MKIGNINTKKKVFIIAEIGNNHEGSFDVAKKTIAAAAKTGVDAVKFQTFIPEHFVSSEDKLRLNKLKKFQLSFSEFRELSKYAKKKGLIFFSTPLDLISAKFLNKIQPIYKISSGDNNYYPLIDMIANFGKPIIVSTGIADIDTIKKVYNRILRICSKKKIKQSLALLHCVSSYPVPNEQANLSSISHLKEVFPDIVVGYSDHTIGITSAVLSVTAGARIIEKHFTLDKNYSDFRDHKLSADQDEMLLMVKKIREAEKILGKNGKKPQLCEKNMDILARRSIGVNCNIKKGTKVLSSHLTWLRPGNGFSPGQEKKILGKKLIRNLKSGEIIKKSDLYES